MNMTGTAMGAATSIANMYLSVEQSKAEAKRIEELNKRNTAFTAQMITLSYESILSASTEISDDAAKQQLQVLKQAHKAEGEAIVSSASIGATGKRVELQRAQNIEGAAGDAITQIADINEREQNKLIDKARYITRKHIQDLLASWQTPDKPPSFAELALPAVTNVAKGYISDVQFDKAHPSDAPGEPKLGAGMDEDFTIL